jgi:uncharacterized membrane protein YbhN (UPF0104 family)
MARLRRAAKCEDGSIARDDTIVLRRLCVMMRKKLLHNLSLLISVLLFLAAAGIIHHKLKGYHLHDILQEVGEVPLGMILAGVFFTILNYVVLTAYDALALRYIRAIQENSWPSPIYQL